jgi:DNA polymerase III delta prime subunit
MHSFILDNPNPEDIVTRINKLTGLSIKPKDLEAHADIITIKPDTNIKTTSKKTSIKIESIRELHSLLSKKPLMLPLQLAVIWGADQLTLAAQQALLKLLEEPSRQTNIFMICHNYKNLLPTIQSRCQVVRFFNTQSLSETEDDTDFIREFESLCKMSPIERMAALEPYAANRERCLDWLENTVRNLSQKMVKSRSQDLIKRVAFILKNTQVAYSDISRNINIKLSLDNLALTWDKPAITLDASSA